MDTQVRVVSEVCLLHFVTIFFIFKPSASVRLNGFLVIFILDERCTAVSLRGL